MINAIIMILRSDNRSLILTIFTTPHYKKNFPAPIIKKIFEESMAKM